MWDQAFPLTFMIDGNATDRQLARRWGAVMLPPPPPKIGDVFAASGVFRVAFAAPLGEDRRGVGGGGGLRAACSDPRTEEEPDVVGASKKYEDGETAGDAVGLDERGDVGLGKAGAVEGDDEARAEFGRRDGAVLRATRGCGHRTRRARATINF